jgi:hypothetical protein
MITIIHINENKITKNWKILTIIQLRGLVKNQKIKKKYKTPFKK